MPMRNPPPIDAVYSDCLRWHGRGLALFDPTPTGESEYMRVGDVGHVVRGQFWRGFNVFCEAGDPLNRLGVPENFTPVDTQFQEVVNEYPV